MSAGSRRVVLARGIRRLRPSNQRVLGGGGTYPDRRGGCPTKKSSIDSRTSIGTDASQAQRPNQPPMIAAPTPRPTAHVTGPPATPTVKSAAPSDVPTAAPAVPPAAPAAIPATPELTEPPSATSTASDTTSTAPPATGMTLANLELRASTAVRCRTCQPAGQAPYTPAGHADRQPGYERQQPDGCLSLGRSGGRGPAERSHRAPPAHLRYLSAEPSERPHSCVASNRIRASGYERDLTISTSSPLLSSVVGTDLASRSNVGPDWPSSSSPNPAGLRALRAIQLPTGRRRSAAWVSAASPPVSSTPRSSG